MLHAFITILVFAASLLVWWVRKTFTFWSDKGIIYLTFWQYLCFVYDVLTKPFCEVVLNNYKRYGRLYGSYQGTTPTLVVADPEMLQDIFATQFRKFSDRSTFQFVGSDVWRKELLNLSGEEWKKARTVFTRAVTTARLRTVVIKVRTTAERLTTRIVDAATKNKPVNIAELVRHTALDITAALNYSIDLDSKNEPNHALIKCLEGIYVTDAGWKALMLFLMPNIYKMVQPDYPTKSSTDVFKAYISHFIEERKAHNKEEDDFLQAFMNADYDWEEGGENADNAQKKRLSLDEITAQGIGFFVGGVESTSSTVVFTTYYLALNPDCQERAIAEVDNALSEGDITYDALQKMPYLEACIKEAIRLCTPDPILFRLCTEETTVAGIRFQPGMCIEIPMQAIHHDPEHYPDPEKFNPERFLPENKDSVRPFTYLPFGAGPRNCAGMRLGMVQVKATLVSLFRHVRFEACPETMIPLKFKPCQFVPDFDGPLLLRAMLRNPATNKDAL
ncbi:hypothetical protein V5799_020095 [Amblyomma americanum]|uniref:Cytochrome n=1 Tax=Amblyomma americanum TaxID=6943 RepID=A0AAQ4EVR6_AMBAM